MDGNPGYQIQEEICMARQTTPYIYGNTARSAAPHPYYNNEEEIRRRQQERKQHKKHRQPKPRVDKAAVLLTCLTFAAVMVVGIFYIHLQFQSTYLSKSVIELESEVVEMEKTNKAAMTELENSLDLRAVYKKATKELGMKAASKDQIYTYESKKSTQIRQYSSPAAP